MIRIVTFEREYGSGAADIAAKVADQLGWKLWDQLFTDQIARSLRCDQRQVEEREERRDPLHYRLFKAFLRGSFEGNLASARGVQLADAESIRQASEKLVRAAAEEGKAVIVGRGSAYYLHERPDAFHVFIYGPFEEKVRRLQRQGKSEKEAVELVETVDQDRADFIKQSFGVDWPQRQYFDLMVNSVVGEERAARIILNALAAMNEE
ncbi:MAG TPA: cytidylate kinase-like family protein [Bryobacteraceae bacterium]|nr:cytidylate kinase-like family protein [Bryobacteraceae bacterium]